MELRTDSKEANERTVDDLLKQVDLDKDTTPTEDVDPEVVEDSPNSEEDEGVEDELTEEELLERKKQVLELKESGNSSFRNGDYEDAIRLYRSASDLCKHKDLYPDRAILYSNRAASELKLGLSKPAIHSASQAVKFNPDFPKGYLRWVGVHSSPLDL